MGTDGQAPRRGAVLEDPPATEGGAERGVPIVVTGAGVVSPIGVGLEEFYAGLAEGRSGIREEASAATTGVPLSARIEDLGARRHFDPRALRRFARISQLALVASREALVQAGLEVDGQGAAAIAGDRVGVVFGTGVGSLRETVEFMKGYLEGGPEAASPMLFPSSVMNAAAGQVAIELKLRGANSTVNHREASPLDALRMASDLLSLGRADAVLAGGMDEVDASSLHAFGRLARLSRAGVRPYAAERDGTAPGEGAAVFMLEREADARRRGARILARLWGGWSAGDEAPRMGWGRERPRMAATLRRAIDEAGLRPGDIGYVAGSGCGLDLDALEARALAEVEGLEAPVGSILGQLGEFMAAGALRVAAGLYALERQALPGTVGAGSPDPRAPIRHLVREPRPARVDAVLVPSLSQGGSDGAVVLAR